jgi:hypothetical protein
VPNNDKNQKTGFAGLAALATKPNISLEKTQKTVSLKKPETSEAPKVAVPKKPPLPKAEPKSEATKGVSPENAPYKKGETKTAKEDHFLFWLLFIVSIIFITFLLFPIINFSIFSDKPRVTNTIYPPYANTKKAPIPNSLGLPEVLRNSGLDISLPPMGYKQFLSLREIRWCVQGWIQLKAMTVFIAPSDPAGVKALFDDCQSRCLDFQYNDNNFDMAIVDLSPYSVGIILEIFRHSGYIHRFKSNNPPSRPLTPAMVTEVQELLTSLGYDPGPIDGLYGLKTVKGLQQFQREAGIPDDGLINDRLINFLRLIKQLDIYSL